MALTGTDVNETQAFKQTALIDQPVPTFKASPKIVPNPFTGLPQRDAYAREHHIVNEPGVDTVLEATRTNPVE